MGKTASSRDLNKGREESGRCSEEGSLGRGKSKGKFGRMVPGEFKEQRDAGVAGMGLLGVGGRS